MGGDSWHLVCGRGAYMHLRMASQFWCTVGVCHGHHPYGHPQLLSGKEPKSVDHRRHQSHNHKAQGLASVGAVSPLFVSPLVAGSIQWALII